MMFIDSNMMFIDFNMTPSVDCYVVGAVPELNP